jgi:multicomponent K+:H+ antiporter subunit E
MKIVPPFLTLVLVAIWLLLNNSASRANVLLGFVIAVLLMLSAAQLRPVQPRLKRWWEIVPLVIVVLIDILRSNVAVARIVLGLVRHRAVRSGFMKVPLALRDPHGLAMLAAIITSTPGTAWGGVSEDGKWLTLHVLDLKDEDEWIRTIKERYERRLMRIFE